MAGAAVAALSQRNTRGADVRPAHPFRPSPGASIIPCIQSRTGPGLERNGAAQEEKAAVKSALDADADAAQAGLDAIVDGTIQRLDQQLDSWPRVAT